jgi:hypothetical protein
MERSEERRRKTGLVGKVCEREKESGANGEEEKNREQRKVI